MPTFDLVTHSAKISTPVRGHLTAGTDRWRLGLRATFRPGSTLTLATGEDVAALEMVVTFSAADEGADPVSGAVHYFPGTIMFDCLVTREVISELLGFAKQGRFPSSVSVGTESDALTHDWRPDGSGLVWANDRADTLPLANMWFEMPVGEEPTVLAAERPPTDWAQWTFWLLAAVAAFWIIRGV
jgi:hypothetical protein